MGPTESDAQDDAQRTMEQRALRNVRGLVDKVEAEDRKREVADRRAIISLALVAASAAILIAAVFFGKAAWFTLFPPEPKGMQSHAKVGVTPDTAGAYRDHFVAKVNTVYKKADHDRGLRGTAVVRVAIRPDGSVESMEIARTSGQKLLDQTAMDIVRRAEPFDAFARHGVAGTRAVQVTHAFTFAE